MRDTYLDTYKRSLQLSFFGPAQISRFSCRPEEKELIHVLIRDTIVLIPDGYNGCFHRPSAYIDSAKFTEFLQLYIYFHLSEFMRDLILVTHDRYIK